MIITQTNGGNQVLVVSNLKKASATLLLLVFILFFFATAQTYVNVSATNVRTASAVPSSADVQVDEITHSVTIRDYGLVVVNDTLKLSSTKEDPLQTFSIGFPFNYGSNLDYGFAYKTANPDERLRVELDVGLGERIGFYGVRIVFPEPGVNLTDVGSYNLTVVFVFSNLISTENQPTFNVTFPLYPSLTQTAPSCNVTVTLPQGTQYANSILEEKGLDFNVTTVSTNQVLNHTTSLESFQYEPAWLTFNLTGPFPIFESNEIEREITLDQWGGAHLSDSYRITNKGSTVASTKIRLPQGVRSVSARDVSGDLTLDLNELPNATVTFRAVLSKDEETKFTLTYDLPWENYVKQHGWRDYTFSFTLLEQTSWTTRKLSITLILPEGADFQSSRLLNPDDVEKSVLQETVTFSLLNVTPFHDLRFDLTYGYVVFWASFRPTLWIGILAIVVSAITFLWRAPKPPPVPIIPVPPENLRSFVEAYERKTRILLELESMEGELRKGRIPRRRYKVRRKMLEGRLSTLSRELGDLREKIGTAGPKYANTMKQIEVAETMLEGAETDIRRVEARYRGGEISKGAYGRLLEEYHRARERAKTTIDGVLLRLREEIR